jgi:hypothetical protein
MRSIDAAKVPKMPILAETARATASAMPAQCKRLRDRAPRVRRRLPRL